MQPANFLNLQAIISKQKPRHKKRLKIKGVKTGTIYLDREFFNRDVISKFDELNN